MKPSPARKRSNLRFALRVIGLLLRGFALIFITLLAIVVGAVLSFPKIIDSEKARDIIVTQFSDILKRPVQIEAVVLTPQGVKLQGVKVFSKSEPGKPQLESRTALVTVKLQPLLERRLEIRHIRLVEPRVRVWRDETGVWSFADLFPSSATVRPASAGRFLLPGTLAADTTDVEGGTLEIDDRYRSKSTRFDQVNLTLHRFSFDKPVPVAAKFDNVLRFADREFRSVVALEGSVFLASGTWTEAYVRAERFEARVEGRVFRGDAGLTNFTQPVIEGDVLAPALATADWQVFIKKPVELLLPPSRWKVRMELTAPKQYKVTQLQGTAGSITATAAGTLDFTADKPRMEAFVTASEFPLDALAAYKPSIAHFGFKGKGFGEAGVSGWTDKLIVHRAKLHLRGFSAVTNRYDFKSGDWDIEASQDFSHFALKVGNGSVAAFRSFFSDVAASFTIAGSDLKLEGGSLRWEGAKVRLRGSITNLAKPKNVEVSGTADKVRWEKAQDLYNAIVTSFSTRTVTQIEGTPWLQTFKYSIPKKFPDTIGNIQVNHIDHANFTLDNAEVLWDIRGVSQNLDRVNGDIYLGFGGVVRDIPAVQESNKFLNIVFLPYIYLVRMIKESNLSLSTVNPKTFGFKRIEGDFSIDQGVVATHYLTVNSDQLLLYADGKADVGRGERVHMGVLTRLTHVAEKLPEFWEDEKGRPAIGFTVSGDVNHPGLEVRLKKIKEHEIEEAIAAGNSRAKARFEVIKKLQLLEEKQ